LAVDLRAFSGELVWFAPLLGKGKQSWEHFAHQPCGRSIRPFIFSLGWRSAFYNSLSGAGMQASNSSACRNDTALPAGMGYPSALGLQTQQFPITFLWNLSQQYWDGRDNSISLH
jgi:hypothetical protein